jgi:hypothetical protein
MNNLTNEIKTALLYNLVFKNSMYASCEVSCLFGSADVLAFPKKESILKIKEYEIKVSKSDLKNDFIKKKNKHTMLEKNIDEYPNYFYFVIPLCLKDYCLELLHIYKKEKYGLIVYSENSLFEKDSTLVESDHYISHIEDRLVTVKNAQKLRDISATTITQVKNIMFKRLINDNLGFYKEKHFNTSRYKSVKKLEESK